MLQVLIYLLIFTVANASENLAEKDYFENEFILGDEQENVRNAMRSPANKWPDGIVPYRFDSSFIERDRAAVLNAMEVFRKKTCIKFLFKRSNHTEHVLFKKSDAGCGTLVGFKGNQSEPMDVFLTENCLNKCGAIQHELLHVLGLWHEQSRPDRDQYVDIIWDNIQPNHKHNFAKKDSDLVETFDLPYDFNSMMHYPNDAFAKPGTNVTIVSKKDPNQKLGQIDEPTWSDLEKIRRMYNCK